MERVWYVTRFPLRRGYIVNGPLQDIARNMAQACLGKGRSAKREVKFYTLARSKAQGHTGPGRGNEGGTD